MGAKLTDLFQREVGRVAWLELPAGYGAGVWASLLAKGSAHKYIKRVPSGRTTKTGKPVYRYYYAVHRGYGIDHEAHFVEGAGFKHGDGHYHIRSVDGDRITIEHDETGDKRTLTRSELSALLRGEHGAALDAYAAKLHAMHAEAVASGASPKQLARIRTMARRRQVSLPEPPAKEPKDEQGRADRGGGVRRPDAGGAGASGRDDGGAGSAAPKEVESAAVSEFLGPTEATASEYLSDPVGRRAWVPVPSPAVTLHEDLAPVPTVKLPEAIKVFPHPDAARGITQLFSHQIDGAERALTAFESGDGIVVSDDAGLGKTNTGMATMLGYGGKRNIIVVPTAGKRGISKQWEETAELYGHPVKRGMPAHPNEEGTFIVSYDELTHARVSEDGKKRAAPELAKPLRAPWDLVIFDESHNLANPGSVRTQAAMQLQGATGKALYLSATPFTNIADMHYLTKLGMFENRKGFLDWAKIAGAQVDGDQVKNPSSPLPMAAVAATLHVDGKMLKRVAQLKGLTSQFGIMDDKSAVHPANNPDAHATFQGAAAIFDLAANGGVLQQSMVDAFRSSWARQYWETLKVPEAIEMGKKALAEGKQVAFYTSFKSADHAHLRALVNIAHRKAERAMDKFPPDLGAAAHFSMIANQISGIIDSLPKVKPAVQELVAAFGGPGVVAEIHGDTTKKPEDEQRAYQRGEKRVVVATMARGGTGISLHDDRGLAPRVQINLSLPWSGREFNQVAGRSHRLGSKSDTTMHWLVGDDETERKNAAIVAKRLKSMGSLTVGDPDATVESRQLANWEFGNTLSGDESAADLAEAALTADTDDNGGTDEAQAARDYFREYAEARKSGRDVLGEEYQRRTAERQKRVHSAARKAILQLATRFPRMADAVRFAPRSVGEDGAYGVDVSLKDALKRAGVEVKGKIGQRWYINPADLPQMAKDANVHRVEVDAAKLADLKGRHEARAGIREEEPVATPTQGGEAPVPATIGAYTRDWIKGFDGGIDRLATLTSSKLADRYLPAGKRKFWEDVKRYVDHEKAGGESILPSLKAPVAPTHIDAANAAQAATEASPSYPALAKKGIVVSKSGNGYVLTGNTYDHRDAIKRAGGKWDSDAKGWKVPATALAELER